MQKVVERILNLLAFLLTTDRPVTADEVRHTVAGYDRDNDEAFRRMFERDKDLLRTLGVPLTTRATDAWEVETGYVVPSDEYGLLDPKLNDDERVALLLARQAVLMGGTAEAFEPLLKLGGLPALASPEPFAADLALDDDSISKVFEATTNRVLVTFAYRGTLRRVAPYGLVHRRGNWYVVGSETGTEEVKAFRLDRFESDVTMTSTSFERPAGVKVSDAIPGAPWEAGGEFVEAVVLFDAELAWWAERRMTDRATTESLANGGLRATIPVRNVDAFFAWMIDFADKAVIEGPADLRSRFVERVRGNQ
jgi:proteasome accessory factor B